MKRLTVFLAVVIALAVTAPAFAQANSCTGPHYTLNIIGVSKGKKVDMEDSHRRTIFVPIDTSGSVAGSVKISYIAGDTFQVLDGNCTDADGCLIEVPSEPLGDLCYDVFATALGTPFGNAGVEAQCVIEDLIGECTDALLLDNFEVSRERGKPRPENISNIFRASGCIDLGGVVGVCDSGDLQFNNVWIFNIPQLLEYWWDYTNDGLRLMQVRFCETTCGGFTTVP